MILVALFSDTALTAVAADKLTSAGEAVDGQTALIGAALAFGHGGRKGQRIDAVDRKHCCLISGMETLPRDKRRTEGTHDTGDVRADRLAVCDAFEAAQDGIIVKVPPCTTICRPSCVASETLITLYNAFLITE